ncbi:putative DNA modification/repair radical SAM protein [Thermospira aquatica]|uniref:DNA modification/repair radical SAM protein n=1 Tax=Thermospira aquatica TaxID=2828656 RepID=A0AAX3BEA1_9SPIR|nr:putative DNA modification/repair radical SAM protein [Thermospira aquatica]URA10450.1 putative DNA modification/repair radical SAM protein [Thermospira aquatica]
MTIQEKLSLLAGAARYDASCASSGSERYVEKGIGSTLKAGICHSWSDDGRCISLLKVLLTNICIYDCAYCVNRRSNTIPRAIFTVDELVFLTMEFYRRNYIEGLFLSSGVFQSPDVTMQMMIDVVKKLRKEQGFYGYIHMKAIPGASLHLLDEAGKYVDRLSANIELPSEGALKKLAPEKNGKQVFSIMGYITDQRETLLAERKKGKKAPLYVPAGQSTQVIVGATPDTDKQILRLSHYLYQKIGLKRVYYSAYTPVNPDPRLPSLSTMPPLKREHRLYQADWLLRFYHFDVDELFDRKHDSLDERFDPKTWWALTHRDMFPVEVSTADYETLLRVPGIGVKSAKRIISARRYGALSFESLKKMGVVMKRAQFFITCQGISCSPLDLHSASLEDFLAREENSPQQLSLFKEPF